MMDLSFLFDREKAIQLRNEVIEELNSWNGILSTEDEDKYYKIINTLTLIIDTIK